MDQQMSDATRHSGDIWAGATSQPRYLAERVPQHMPCHYL